MAWRLPLHDSCFAWNCMLYFRGAKLSTVSLIFWPTWLNSLNSLTDHCSKESLNLHFFYSHYSFKLSMQLSFDSLYFILFSCWIAPSLYLLSLHVQSLYCFVAGQPFCQKFFLLVDCQSQLLENYQLSIGFALVCIVIPVLEKL